MHAYLSQSQSQSQKKNTKHNMDTVEYMDDKSSKRLERRKLRRKFYQCVTFTFLGLSFYVMSLMHKNNQRSLLSSSSVSSNQWKMRRAAMILNNQGKGNDNKNRKLSLSNPHKWINPLILPNLPGEEDVEIKETLRKAMDKISKHGHHNRDFRISYRDEHSEYKEWEKDADKNGNNSQPRVDYRKMKYKYPNLLMTPPNEEGVYPKMQPLEKILDIWPQDDLDNEEEMEEVLLHFDYSNVTQRNAAMKFRDAEIPFKVYNVPEINIASIKWTDAYVSRGFKKSSNKAAAQGHCQQSDNNYFAYFRDQLWDVDTMGPPPTMDNDWDYNQWAKHARYADQSSLPFYKKHYYWQTGVPPQYEHDKSFISRDLPSFSATENNFFSFHVDEQRGIQCRFGERGVTAATHYDGGRNMVAM